MVGGCESRTDAVKETLQSTRRRQVLWQCDSADGYIRGHQGRRVLSIWSQHVMDALLVEFLHRIEALQTEVRLHLESHNTAHFHEEYALTGHEHAPPPEPEPEPEKDLPPPEPEPEPEAKKEDDGPKAEDETPEKAPERHHPLHGRIGGSK